MLFNTVSYFKFNFKLKIDKKCVFLITCKKFEKSDKLILVLGKTLFLA